MPKQTTIVTLVSSFVLFLFFSYGIYSNFENKEPGNESTIEEKHDFIKKVMDRRAIVTSFYICVNIFLTSFEAKYFLFWTTSSFYLVV